LPACWLTAATSLASSLATVFGTGRATVGLLDTTTRACTAAALLTGRPNPALPSVTGMGGRLDTSAALGCPTSRF
jgi:hypothetical protein